MEQLGQLLVGGLRIGSIYALVALGLVVIHKSTRVVNFAQGAFAMLGAYGAYIWLNTLELPYALAYVVVPLVTGLAAVLIERGVLKPMRSADPFVHVIATVFIAIALAAGTRRVIEGDLLVVPSFVRTKPWVLGGVVVTGETLWTVGFALAVSLAFVTFFRRAALGRGMRAVASSSRGAELSGYSVDAGHSLAWFMGGALGGLAGVLVAPVTGVTPDIALELIAPIFVAAVLGGFDHFGPTLLAGIGLGVAETLAAGYVSSALKDATSLVVLFGALLLMAGFRGSARFVHG